MNRLTRREIVQMAAAGVLLSGAASVGAAGDERIII